jgi:hypothetical protein
VQGFVGVKNPCRDDNANRWRKPPMKLVLALTLAIVSPSFALAQYGGFGGRNLSAAMAEVYANQQIAMQMQRIAWGAALAAGQNNFYGNYDYGGQELSPVQQRVLQQLMPIYAQHRGEPEWVAAWQHLLQLCRSGRQCPIIAENGDFVGRDNDGDGSPEPVFVRGHFRDGEYVRSHYRALPGFDG